MSTKTYIAETGTTKIPVDYVQMATPSKEKFNLLGVHEEEIGKDYAFECAVKDRVLNIPDYYSNFMQVARQNEDCRCTAIELITFLDDKDKLDVKLTAYDNTCLPIDVRYTRLRRIREE